MSLLDGGTSNPATGETATALTLAQAAERIAAKSAGPEPRERPTAQAEDDGQAEVHADGGEPGEGEAPADGDPEPDEPEPEDGDDDQPEPEALDMDRKVKVKVRGQEMEVSLREALNGYSRLSDYTRDKQTLADERRAWDTQRAEHDTAHEALVAERQQLANLTNVIRTQLLGSLPTEQQLAQLRQTDPGRWAATMEDIRQRVGRVQAIEAQGAQALQRSEQEAQQARAKAVTTAHEALARDIPEWTDAAKRQAIQAEMAGTLRGAGYTDPEIAQIVDPRIIRFVHQAQRDAKDAAAYRALQARNPRTEQRVAEAPRVARPGAAVSGKAVAEGQVRDLRTRLAKSGRVEDAAALIAAKTARK